jgi:hypothetical protein
MTTAGRRDRCSRCTRKKKRAESTAFGKEREGEGQSDYERETETHTERDRQTETATETDIGTKSNIHRQCQRDRQREAKTETDPYSCCRCRTHCRPHILLPTTHTPRNQTHLLHFVLNPPGLLDQVMDA